MATFSPEKCDPFTSSSMLKREDNTEFLYEALPNSEAIRLLELLPGTEDEPLICHFHVYPIAIAPMYEAISYVWGDPQNTAHVIANGRTVTVTSNLGDALRRIR